MLGLIWSGLLSLCQNNEREGGHVTSDHVEKSSCPAALPSVAEGKALKACWSTPDTAGSQTGVLRGKLFRHEQTQTSKDSALNGSGRATDEDQANRLIPLAGETIAVFGGVETFFSAFTAGNLQQQKMAALKQCARFSRPLRKMGETMHGDAPQADARWQTLCCKWGTLCVR